MSENNEQGGGHDGRQPLGDSEHLFPNALMKQLELLSADNHRAEYRISLRSKKRVSRNIRLLVKTGILVETTATRQPDLVSSPPSTFLLSLLLGPLRSEDAIINLEEVYEKWCDKYGIKRARWLFRTHAARMIFSVWWSSALTQLERVGKVVQAFRRPTGG